MLELKAYIDDAWMIGPLRQIGRPYEFGRSPDGCQRRRRRRDFVAVLVSSSQQNKPKMPAGFIKRLVQDKGFGFIAPADGGSDVFFHHSVVAEQGFERLTEDQPVDFELAAGEPSNSRRAGLKAVAVRPRRRPAPPPRDELSQLLRHPRSRAKKPSWRG